EVRRQNGACIWSDCSFRGLRVHRECRRIDIHEYRLQAGRTRYFRNHPEGERRNDNLGTLGYLQRLQNKVKRHAAVFGGYRTHVTAPAEHAAEFFLELRDVRSLNQLFLVAAVRNDFVLVRDHPHSESANRSHRFVSLLKSSNITNRSEGEANTFNLNLCPQFI